MRLFSISDVHVKSPGDFGENLLNKFLTNPDIKSGDYVFLLGDIFDLMIGYHEEYFEQYSLTFNSIEELVRSGVKIFYFEGNHDFHLRKLFSKFCDIRGLDNDHLVVVKSILELNLFDKKIHISHGDDIEIENPSYKIYKKIVNNPFMNIVADFIMPFSLLNLIGENASKNSRARNEKKYSENLNEHIKDKFRKSAELEFMRSKCELIICGHSHVEDLYETDDFTYVNNGYCRVAKKFIVVDEKGPRLENLI